MRPAPSLNYDVGLGHLVSRSHQSKIARQDVSEIVGRAFSELRPADKSGPDQRKLRIVQLELRRKLHRAAPQSGGRARPNEDVKLNRGALYRMLLCLY